MYIYTNISFILVIHTLEYMYRQTDTLTHTRTHTHAHTFTHTQTRQSNFGSGPIDGKTIALCLIGSICVCVCVFVRVCLSVSIHILVYRIAPFILAFDSIIHSVRVVF